MKIKSELSKIIEIALKSADIEADEIVISDATKSEFGDYQFNGVMKLAKILKQNPRQIATSVVEYIDTTGMIAKVEIAGPGFINIWLNNEWLSIQLNSGHSANISRLVNSVNDKKKKEMQRLKGVLLKCKD